MSPAESAAVTESVQGEAPPGHPVAAAAAVRCDFARSPLTGWTRAHHEAIATSSLLALRPHASPGHAGILPPGPLSAAGRDSDALEGFARSFLAAGYLVGGGSSDPADLAGWYARGLISGTRPGSAEAWPRLAAVGQARVEAAAVSIALHESRAQIWDGLSSSEQEQVIDWLAESTTAAYPASNWVLFFAVTQAFLRSVGAPVDEDRVAESLAFMADCHLGQGWFSDGSFGPARPDSPPRPRWPQVDWYNAWVIHHFLVWYARMSPGSEQLAAPWIERLGQWADVAIDLFGGDGAPLFQGRSLTYRFGMLSALQDAAALGVGPDPGMVRGVSSATLRHFLTHDSFVPSGAAAGVLPLGWFGAHDQMRQSYSGPGSPYWAMHGFSGLAWPADNALWTAVERPSRVAQGGVTHRIEGCHWLVTSAANDDIVRVANHGVDHVVPGRDVSDPLYDRLAYSTATAPVERADGDDAPADNEVLVEVRGACHRRRALTEAALTTAGHADLARSSWTTGTQPGAPRVSVVSLPRGQVEVRLVRVWADDRAEVTLSGWPITPGGPVTGSIHALVGELAAGRTVRTDPQPMGSGVVVDWVRGPVVPGWVAVAVVLHPSHQPPPALPKVSIGESVTVEWPDGSTTSVEV